MDKLQEEFQYYLNNKKDFHLKYEGKFIVLKDKKVIGVYDDRLRAINDVKKSYELGSFLVQHVVDTEEQARFHSRFAF